MDTNFPTVTQLIVGYCNCVENKPDIYKACGSVTLIKNPPEFILVDCGNPWNTDILLKALEKEKITANDITNVICTHGHIDHVGNLNLFKNGKIVLDHDIGNKPGVFESYPFENDENLILSRNVEVMFTPGHTSHDLSVIVKNVPDYGIIVVAGDIFENENDMHDPVIWQRSSWNVELQKMSRTKILQIADYVIPGHGLMFKNERID